DGINDMPGLTIPVKYWEIMNEPSMQGGVTGGMGEELKFFVGTSSEYLEILQTSYEVIKETDPTANVVQGGQAGMHTGFQEFWRPVLENGGGDYFDIANIHSISTNSRTEDLFVRKFHDFLAEYGIEDKPIWITEVQFGRLAEPPEDLEEFEILMAKSTVFSLAQGADKLFYIENWTFWNGFNEEMKIEGMRPDFEEVKSSTTHKVYLNLVDKLNQFDEIIVLEEEFTESSDNGEGSHSIVGHYKFIKNNTDSSQSVVYALWGGDQIPTEITGSITVTDIYGESSVMETVELVLGEVPVFVEIKD
ncbi:MAG: hypothetical protein U9Q67_01175, partial [Patescibacteria group bacterium]|nr:hypothetical protein [Patescibacteria group bacterium]